MCYGICEFENRNGECRKPRHRSCPEGTEALTPEEIEEAEEYLAERIIQEREDFKKMMEC